MNKTVNLITIVIIVFLFSCKQHKENKRTLVERLEKISDSIKVDNIVVKNLFKSQILAHKENRFDSLMIVDKVYNPHKELWNNCYGMIFGDENASKFNNPSGMIKWNKTLYLENKAFFDKRAEEILAINLDTALKNNLIKFNKLVPYKPTATISILFTPLQGIGFGGCSSEQFCFELNNKDYEVAYTIEKGLPHELNHLVYEPFRKKNANANTALAQTIDEGFACYFTWLFFDKNIPKYEVVEDMGKEDWDWYMANEKQLFNKVKSYFNDESGDNPLLRNDTHQLFPDAPKSLNYWLGFRIIEKYIENNGENSWKNIYTMNVKEVLEKSGYERYIDKL